jgi:hypothetical protein
VPVIATSPFSTTRQVAVASNVSFAFCSTSSATSAAVTAGACGGALTMVVLPAANAARSLCASRLAGALNGVMASATPTGAR